LVLNYFDLRSSEILVTIEIKSGFLRPIEAIWSTTADHESDVESAVVALRDTFQAFDSGKPLRKLLKGHGMIESQSGVPVRIEGRLLPRWPSLMEVYLDRSWKRLPDNYCRIYYNHPQSCPGFTVLAYACSGRRTSLATLRAGLTVLEKIAILNGNQAIVCQSTNPRIGNRISKHFGYVTHVPHLKGQHYIKRFGR